MDETILKTKDIINIKNFFDLDVIFVNLYRMDDNSTTKKTGKIGKTNLAISFGMMMLERNLCFTGGVHFIIN